MTSSTSGSVIQISIVNNKSAPYLHLVKHLEGPVVDGNIGGTDKKGEDF